LRHHVANMRGHEFLGDQLFGLQLQRGRDDQEDGVDTITKRRTARLSTRYSTKQLGTPNCSGDV